MNPSGRRWWVLANVVLVNVIVIGIAWNYLIMFVPALIRDLGLEISDWGTLWAGIALGVLVFSFPAGVAGDRVGARASLTAGLVLAAVALLWRSAATSWLALLATMVLFGLALALVLTNFPKALATVFPPEELGMANGIAQAGIGLGLGAAAFAAPLVAAPLGGWRGISEALSATTAALALLWWISASEPRSSTAAQAPPPGLSAILQALRVRDVGLIALCYLLYMGGYLGMIGYLPTYLTTVRDIPPESAGALISLGPWSFTVGSLLLPTLSDRIGRRRAVYLPGMLAGGAGVLLAAYATGLPLALAIVAIGFGTGVVALLFVIPVELEEVGEELAGSAIGAATAAGFVGGAISPLVGMALVAIDPILAFGFWTACFVAAAFLILAVRETGKARAPRVP